MGDLKLHVLYDLTEDDLRVYFSRVRGHSYYNPAAFNSDWWEMARNRIFSAPSVFIGEIVQPKMMNVGGREIPLIGPAHKIRTEMGDDVFPIDSALITKIQQAFIRAENTGYRLGNILDITRFLQAQNGRNGFLAMW